MHIRPILLVTLFSTVTLLLAGCGEGWVPQPYDQTPYGDRTAGHGVMYVRANMISEKGPVLEAKMLKTETILEKNAQSELDTYLKDAQPVFNKGQRK